MTKLHLSGLCKTFNGKPPATPMDGLDLDVDDGEFLVLLGPSGCGKTTTLRSIAGLETPDAGSIRFGDKPVFDSEARINLPPEKRSIGMVFQSYALWPHMTVRKNIAYPLKARRLKSVSAGWVEETAALVDCSHLLDRYPSQLSGGQQQRVALARGLVARPDVMLFDEPMSNLDARLRTQVRSQLHELHRRLNTTAVFVTHDQVEALALADRIAIMHSGEFEQVGRPQEVFEHPATERVAEFIGMANRLVAMPTHDGYAVDGVALGGSPWLEQCGASVTVRLRPEDVVAMPPHQSAPDGCATIAGTVVDSQFGGRNIDVVTMVGESRVVACVASDAYGGWAVGLEPGDPLTLAFQPSRTATFAGPSGTIAEEHPSPSPAGKEQASSRARPTVAAVR